MTSQEQILAVVSQLLTDVIGDDMPDVEIGMETSFSDELELESIEFVALAEKLRNHFGERVDFTTWLSEKELDEILSLSIGDLVHFIHTCLSSTPTE